MHQIIVIWYKNGTHFLDKRGYNFVTLPKKFEHEDDFQNYPPIPYTISHTIMPALN